MNNNNILFNYNFLLIDQEHLRQYSLYKLYTLRYKILKSSKNFDINTLNTIIERIDKVIYDKPKGYMLMKILNNISYLNIQITLKKFIKSDLKYKYIQLQIFEYKNQCETIFDIPIDSTLTFEEKLLKYYLKLNVSFEKFKDDLIQCKIKL